ncbi:MAG: biotin/lipoyl-binding protein, partial [Bacteroidales bacterium]|nr:biotin/lipoyl-binding protein [Bacteroidales bacterium]
MKQQQNYNLVIGLLALIGIILTIAVIGYIVSKPKPLVLQGEAEASEYRVSGMVPGRVETLFVKQGDKVQKGDTVAYIRSYQVQAKMAQATSVKAAAQAQSA